MKFQTQKIIKAAEVETQAKNYAKASLLYYKALGTDSENIDLKIKYGTSLFNAGEFEKSAQYFHELHTKFPDDLKILNGCALAYLRLGIYEIATKFLKKIVANNPQDYESWVNLCFAAGSSGEHTDSIFYAMQALQIKPLETRAHNNLGSVLLSIGRYEDALISFDTALKIEPGNVSALSNIATAYSLMGNPKHALEIYEQCLNANKSNPIEHKSIQFRRSFDLLRTGNLKDGWEMYEYGFIPKDIRSRMPKRQFTAPRWDGSPLKDKRLLIWREQGLGDEIMFLSTLKEAHKLCNNIVVECDGRLVPLLQRSFPSVEFRQQAYLPAPSYQSVNKDFDYQIPMGSLMKFFRSSFEDFKNSAPFLVADNTKKSEFATYLKSLPNKIKIGICWRSGALNAERNSSYTSISDWEPILKLKNIDFINLQYGECAAEIKNVFDHFGIQIHQPPAIDLKNDLDDLTALMSCLDHVISAKTAVSEMAPAAGVPTSILMPDTSWVLFGQKEYLIHPKVRAYTSHGSQALSQLIPEIAEDLNLAYSLNT